MKKRITGYLCLCFTLCLIPFLGMAGGSQNDTTENRSLKKLPEFKEEKGWNINYLKELGEYFEDHFGFRSQLVTANAQLQYEIFGVSAVESVIAGKDGWLFYKDSLNDYLGVEQMSERDLFNLAHSLSIMQRYVESRGGRFLFIIAPNKNSLYGEYMPYYDCVKAGEEKNLLRLPAFLKEKHSLPSEMYLTER